MFGTKTEDKAPLIRIARTWIVKLSDSQLKLAQKQQFSTANFSIFKSSNETIFESQIKLSKRQLLNEKNTEKDKQVRAASIVDCLLADS